MPGCLYHCNGEIHCHFEQMHIVSRSGAQNIDTAVTQSPTIFGLNEHHLYHKTNMLCCFSHYAIPMLCFYIDP